MTDSELQMMVLRGMYEHRDTADGQCYYQDFQSKISGSGFSRICAQLHQKGLIKWKSAGPGSESIGAGFGVITAAGVDLIEEPPRQNEQVGENMPMKTTSAHCPKCGDEREVLVLFSEKNEEAVLYDPDDAPAVFYEKLDLLKCAGCKFVFLQKANWNTEAQDKFGRPWVAIESFPKWAKEPIPDWITSAAEGSSVSAPIFEKLREVLLAFESKWYWLACVGCRSVLEAAMIEKIDNQGSFKANLDAYQAAGHIMTSDKEQLKIVIEAGHGATHRSLHPKREQVKIAIDIVCRILQGVYVHAPQAADLGKAIPPRQ
jgi:Domain of unknown function (DUF4145)